MKNSLILFLYGVALFFVLRTYYNEGNSGMPTPTVLAAPTYLYGILSIVSGFTGALTVPIAAGLTVSLIWQTNARAPENLPKAKTNQIFPLPDVPTKKVG